MSRALALVNSADESRQPERPDQSNAQPVPLLETKLYVPRSEGSLVPRPRLLDAVTKGASGRLTVVVAPAGFGKTTMLAGWLANAGGSTGWVSLDPGDNDPTLFWRYIIRALQRVRPNVGATALEQLRSPRAPALEAIIASLLNDVDALDEDVVLVLDDYHVIDAEPVHRSLAFFLDHLPVRLHLVIASRADPPLPLPRLRARGELAEVRPADMRFTTEEAAAFLNQVMGLGLSASDMAILERRTEGWIAGLKLAALSLKGRSDAHAFVDTFSGDNRFIADYLVEEVLRSEPVQVRRFLLSTAILDRLSAPVCDAVTDSTGSQAVLEDLERRNLFLVALDDRREWFRFHHLFADVLAHQARRSDADALRAARVRASAWYEQHGSMAEAVRHAFAAHELERAAALLERTWPENNRSYQSAQWLAQVKTLPDDIIRSRPVLSMAYAWGLLNSGDLESAEPRLQDVERWLQRRASGDPALASPQMRASSEERLQSLPRELAAARVYLAQALGEAQGTLEHAMRELDRIPETDHAARATAIALVALAHWGRGELDAAHATFTRALEEMRVAGHDLDRIRGIFVLGDIRAAQGRLRDAAAHHEHGLRVAADARYASAETDELHLGLSELHREWNDLGSATRHLDAMTRTVRSAGHKGNLLRWGTAMARVHEARGAFDAALDALDEAERHERRDPLPRARPIPAMKARIALAQGRLETVAEWASAARVSVDDSLGYLREYEHITLARLLLARAPGDAIPLLERLLAAAQRGGRVGSVIEILALQSLAQLALRNQRAALDALSQALALAEPEGFLRVFLDEGNTMRDLLRTLTARGLATEYTRRVLAAFDAPTPVTGAAPADAPGVGPVAGIQPLTARELEILRLIAAGLRNQAIADHLSISAATVKRHIANAYAKLGVAHRTEALVRAKELRLL